MEITSEMLEALKQVPPAGVNCDTVVMKLIAAGLVEYKASGWPGGAHYRLTKDGESLLEDVYELVGMED